MGILLRATLILTLACIVGSLAIMPTIIAARAHAHAAAIPAWELYGSAVIQSILLFGPASFLGLWAARSADLKGAPFVMQLAGGDKAGPLARGLAEGLAWGLLAGALVVLLDVFVFQSAAVSFKAGNVDALIGGVFWQSLLGGVLYGGINEEVLLRLFLVSALIWGVAKLFGTQAAHRRGVAIAVVIFAALVFGASHLPYTSMLSELNTLLVVRALVLNGIVGVVAGYLYLRRGFEAAVASHAAAHIPIQLGQVLLS